MRALPCGPYFMLTILLACSGPSAGPSQSRDAAGAPDAAVEMSPDLGESCPMGCNLTLCTDTASTSCENGICVWDGRFGIDAYCSQPCGAAPCPAGWSCLDSDDGEGRFCFAESAECGNGVLERGEACDPGPTAGQPASGCSADCSRALMVSGGTVELTIDGAALSFSGDSEGQGDADVTTEVVELADGTRRFAAGVQVPGFSLALTIDGPLPAELPARVTGSSVHLTYLDASWCFALPPPFTEGAAITVDSWDGRRMTGRFDGLAEYARCCSFCQDPADEDRAVTASRFDVFLAAPAEL